MASKTTGDRNHTDLQKIGVLVVRFELTHKKTTRFRQQILKLIHVHMCVLDIQAQREKKKQNKYEQK